MNKLLYLSIPLLACSLWGCQKETGDDNGNDKKKDKQEETFIATKEKNPTILIEKFTGQNCHWCPVAEAYLDTVYEKYPDNVIVADYYVGRWTPNKKMVMPQTNELEKYLDLPLGTVPLAVFNRSLTGFGNKYVGDFKNYMKEAVNQMKKPKMLSLNLKSKIIAGNKVEVMVSSQSMSSLKGNVKLNILLLENNIKDYQTLEDGTADYNYMHKNVVKAFLTPYMGENYMVGSAVTHTYSLPSNIENMKNVSVVAFVTYANKPVVIQAERQALSSSSSSTASAQLDVTINRMSIKNGDVTMIKVNKDMIQSDAVSLPVSIKTGDPGLKDADVWVKLIRENNLKDDTYSFTLCFSQCQAEEENKILQMAKLQNGSLTQGANELGILILKPDFYNFTGTKDLRLKLMIGKKGNDTPLYSGALDLQFSK